MILKQLLEDIHDGLGWWGIVDHLIKLYPDQGGNADGYLTTVAELLVTDPGDAHGFSLHVVMETEPSPLDDDDFEPWAHVFGQDGTPNRETYLESGYTEQEISDWDSDLLDAPANYAMELTPWEELLAMDVVSDLPLPDTLVYILWEITFFGYSNDKVKEKNAKLTSDTEEMETTLKEQRGE